MGVIVIAATNRPDVLDPALLRPGRFDRQVHVSLPDIRGREAILKVHVRKVPLDDSVDLSIIARGTPGFSGADLANLINEAALFAARAGRKTVTMEEFELAKDKVLMGVERRSMVMPEEERRNTAYHESGHTVVAKVLKDQTDPVHKVTIIPRGQALGVPSGHRVSSPGEILVEHVMRKNVDTVHDATPYSLQRALALNRSQSLRPLARRRCRKSLLRHPRRAQALYVITPLETSTPHRIAPP